MKHRSLFACLADEARLGIVEALASDGELCVSELVERVDKERSNVSHHLAELRSCGLVLATKRGRHKDYRLAHPDLMELVEQAHKLAIHIEAADAEACMQRGCCP